MRSSSPASYRVGDRRRHPPSLSEVWFRGRVEKFDFGTPMPPAVLRWRCQGSKSRRMFCVWRWHSRPISGRSRNRSGDIETKRRQILEKSQFARPKLSRCQARPAQAQFPLTVFALPAQNCCSLSRTSAASLLRSCLRSLASQGRCLRQRPAVCRLIVPASNTAANNAGSSASNAEEVGTLRFSQSHQPRNGWTSNRRKPFRTKDRVSAVRLR